MGRSDDDTGRFPLILSAIGCGFILAGALALVPAVAGEGRSLPVGMQLLLGAAVGSCIIGSAGNIWVTVLELRGVVKGSPDGASGGKEGMYEG